MDKKEEKQIEGQTKEEKKNKNEKNVFTYSKEQIEEFNNTLKNAEEKALRAQAELINYRKRKDDEVSKMLNYCNEGIITDLLLTIDNLERALKEDDNSKLKEGVNMIYTSFKNTLEKYGLKEIEAEGKKFDANIHQAVTTDSVKDVDEGVILEVMQKGYMLKDKVIRPAMVKVNR